MRYRNRSPSNYFRGPMEFSAADIAQLLEGQVEGNEQVRVSNVSKIEEGKPGTLTFLANPKYEEHIYKTQASIALVGRDFMPSGSIPSSLTLIRVDDAYASLAKLLAVYQSQSSVHPGISEHADIHPSASIGQEVFIGAFVHIGANCVIEDGAQIFPNSSLGSDVRVGKGTVIRSNVSIYERSQIGDDCIIHGGVTIGADGFGFAPKGSGYDKVPQIGNVVIQEGVEIGAGTCIDRATLGSTIIEKGVKLDNLIQIAHNVVIGENTVIAAQTGIAGSTKIGKNCMIGGQVGIIGHIEIADEVKIAAQSGIGHPITEVGAIVQGSPAIPNRDFKRAFVNFVKLPEFRDRLIRLEKLIAGDRPTADE